MPADSNQLSAGISLVCIPVFSDDNRDKDKTICLSARPFKSTTVYIYNNV